MLVRPMLTRHTFEEGRRNIANLVFDKASRNDTGFFYHVCEKRESKSQGYWNFSVCMRERECKKTSKKETKPCTRTSFRMQMHFTAQCCCFRFLSCSFRVCRSFRDSCWSRCWCGQVGLRIKFAGRRLVVAMAAAVLGISFAVIVTFVVASEHSQLHIIKVFSEGRFVPSTTRIGAVVSAIVAVRGATRRVASITSVGGVLRLSRCAVDVGVWHIARNGTRSRSRVRTIGKGSRVWSGTRHGSVLGASQYVCSNYE